MRSDAYITVTCDGPLCRKDGLPGKHAEVVEIGLCATAGGGYDERYVDSELEGQGWTKEGDSDYCVGCTEYLQEQAEAGQPEPALECPECRSTQVLQIDDGSCRCEDCDHTWWSY